MEREDSAIIFDHLPFAGFIYLRLRRGGGLLEIKRTLVPACQCHFSEFAQPLNSASAVRAGELAGDDVGPERKRRVRRPGGQNEIVQVPVNIANVQGLAAADLTITFDSSVLRAMGADTGTVTPGWSMVSNTDNPGEIRVSMASTGGTVSGSGTLIIIEFEVVGSPAMTCLIQLISVSLNDSAIPVEKADGSFSVDLVYRLQES